MAHEHIEVSEVSDVEVLKHEHLTDGMSPLGVYLLLMRTLHSHSIRNELTAVCENERGIECVLVIISKVRWQSTLYGRGS